MDYDKLISPAHLSLPRIPNAAEWMYERIARSIIDFEKDLDSEHEVGARLVSFTANEVISIDDVGFWGTDMIIFYGSNAEGQPAQLLQHISQVNVLLVAVRVAGEKPNRIGFVLQQKLEEEGSGE
ncbi:DUF6173 family protein [Roseibium aggregatum]|jgi:hypothetical protein|uniref:Uncharacterized protein n=1 Tax=Roseibium aggregatum TaxID=187304 RepID=A0A0M6YFR3_9HYPH|nr:DUF6173 family protein [Roseibium aggregatum]CTQ47670.1 hypothetical protein LAL4801_06132 [Roseibium aggregatum]